jgi:hypothetical protein
VTTPLLLRHYAETERREAGAGLTTGSCSIGGYIEEENS